MDCESLVLRFVVAGGNTDMLLLLILPLVNILSMLNEG